MDFKVDFLKKKDKRGIGPKSIFMWSFGTLIVLYIAVVLCLFFYNLYLGAKAKALANDVSGLSSQLSKQKDLESLNLYLSSKTNSLKDILGFKRQHHQITDYLFSILPSGVSIDGFTITQQNQLQFNGRAESLRALKTFLDNVQSQKSGALIISKASIGGLSTNRGEDKSLPGQYNFSVLIDFLQ